MHIFVALSDNNAFNTNTLISCAIGMLIGAFTSLVVNATLVEISLNSFFAVVRSYLPAS